MVISNDLRDYLRLPPDSTEDLTSFLAAAQSKARTAGIPVLRHNAQYDIFIKALAGLYYDNRGIGLADSSVEAAAKRMIDSFVLELRYAGEDPEVDEGGEGE